MTTSTDAANDTSRLTDEEIATAVAVIGLSLAVRGAADKHKEGDTAEAKQDVEPMCWRLQKGGEAKYGERHEHLLNRAAGILEILSERPSEFGEAAEMTRTASLLRQIASLVEANRILISPEGMIPIPPDQKLYVAAEWVVSTFHCWGGNLPRDSDGVYGADTPVGELQLAVEAYGRKFPELAWAWVSSYDAARLAYAERCIELYKDGDRALVGAYRDSHPHEIRESDEDYLKRIAEQDFRDGDHDGCTYPELRAQLLKLSGYTSDDDDESTPGVAP